MFVEDEDVGEEVFVDADESIIAGNETETGSEIEKKLPETSLGKTSRTSKVLLLIKTEETIMQDKRSLEIQSVRSHPLKHDDDDDETLQNST